MLARNTFSEKTTQLPTVTADSLATLSSELINEHAINFIIWLHIMYMFIFVCVWLTNWVQGFTTHSTKNW